MGSRRTVVAGFSVALLAAAGVTAAVAADPAPDPPPRIAFLANGIVPADALAAGPIAGQLGAPLYTTQQDLLPAGTAEALDAYDPQLVIVMGGPVAIADGVVTQVAAATGLPVVDPSPTPDSGVVRAAGGDRFETATIVAELLSEYAPAYLPVDLQAVDADLLDGQDSTAFLGAAEKAADSDRLDGTDGSDFVTRGTFVHNAIGDWNSNSGGSPVSHQTGQDLITSDSQVVSTFPFVNNGDQLALESVRICVAGGGANISSLWVQTWTTATSGDVSADSHEFTWGQGSSGCQTLTPGANGVLLDESKRVTLWMPVSGNVTVSATTFHYHAR